MPYRVRRIRRGRYAIYNASTGRVFGYSTNRRNAEATARIRNQESSTYQPRRGRGRGR